MTMTGIKNNDFSDVVFKRRSVRHFDPDFKISRDELKQIVKETVTAPSACNLQSWHFEIVDTEAGKEKLKSYFIPFNTPQIDSCSAMILIFGDTQSHKNYRKAWEDDYHAGKITKEAMEDNFSRILYRYEKGARDFLVNDATVDAAMAAMQLLLVVRAHGYEGNAIAGYDTTKAAETFGLDPYRYLPVMAVAVGVPAKNGPAEEDHSDRYGLETILHFVDD